MEDEKKKKKNKKKKNRHKKTTEAVVVVESTSVDNSYGIQNGKTDVLQNDALQNAQVDLDTHHANDTSSASEGAQKQLWQGLEATLVEKIKRLEEENDAQMQKEAVLEEQIIQLQREQEEHILKQVSLEEKIKELQKEIDAQIQKGDGLEGKIKQLQEEKVAHVQKEARLEEKVEKLQKDKDSHLEEEASLETDILKFQSEKDSWLQKEAGYEERINQLVNETDTLSLKGVRLEEKIEHLERERDSWVQTQNSIRETIASLSGDNTKLRTQVLELEESRNSLLKENQLLINNVSGLQSQIQRLERSIASSHLSTDSPMHASADGDIDTQIEAALALVQKLINENAELVEKVNELHAELDRRAVTTRLSSPVGSDSIVVTAKAAHVVGSSAPDSASAIDTAERKEPACVPNHTVESIDMTSVSDYKMLDGVDVVENKKSGGSYLNAQEASMLPNSMETVDSDEIVQIPLEENEVLAMDLQASDGQEEKEEVPLADAPLIGAPFRLISFVTKYVSGADLVNSSSANLER